MVEILKKTETSGMMGSKRGYPSVVGVDGTQAKRVEVGNTEFEKKKSMIDASSRNFEKKTKRGAENGVEVVFIVVGEERKKGEAVADFGNDELTNEKTERGKRRKGGFERSEKMAESGGAEEKSFLEMGEMRRPTEVVIEINAKVFEGANERDRRIVDQDLAGLESEFVVLSFFAVGK
jgi:hypothetical protein